jgi:hypothetical protein
MAASHRALRATEPFRSGKRCAAERSSVAAFRAIMPGNGICQDMAHNCQLVSVMHVPGGRRLCMIS